MRDKNIQEVIQIQEVILKSFWKWTVLVFIKLPLHKITLTDELVMSKVVFLAQMATDKR